MGDGIIRSVAPRRPFEYPVCEDHDADARIEALEKRVESLESTWSAFKRTLRDGLLSVVRWVEKNGE